MFDVGSDVKAVATNIIYVSTNMLVVCTNIQDDGTSISVSASRCLDQHFKCE